MDNQTSPSQEPHPSPIGPLIGSIIIIVVIALGGLYFWANELDKEAKHRALREAQIDAQRAIASSTDDLGSIEADLKKEDIGKLKLELDNIKH